MQITEIAFTGYSVADMKRSRAFYEDILGLKKSRDWENDKWVEYDIGSGCLALITGGGDQWPPGSLGVAAALEVDDFDAYINKLRSSGIKFVIEPLESPVCWMAVINDPDANRLVIHKRKPHP